MMHFCNFRAAHLSIAYEGLDAILVLFIQQLGPSALAGIATVIFIFPLNGFIAKKRSKLQVWKKSC